MARTTSSTSLCPETMMMGVPSPADRIGFGVSPPPPRAHDEGRAAPRRPDRLDDVHPAAVGKEDVEDHTGGVMLLEEVEPFRLVEGGHHLHPLLCQDVLGELGEHRG